MDRQPPLLTLKSLLQIPSLKSIKVKELASSSSSQNTLNTIIANILDEEPSMDHPFYIMDLGMLVTLYHSWVQTVPSIKPYFPVRCNHDPALLATLAALGASFDCASSAEIATVLAMAVPPGRILFSSPCKADDHIKYAANVGVSLLVFDSIEELDKVHKSHPSCSLLLYVNVPPHEDVARNTSAGIRGALPHEVGSLLRHAQKLGLHVSGISLEPEGPGSRPKTLRATMELVQNLFNNFASLHLPIPRVLNVGGGFVYGTGFSKEVSAFLQALQAKNKDFATLSVMATPGRFLAETAGMLVTSVIGKRVRSNLREYWINDGVYGSMNAVVYHGKGFQALPFAYGSCRLNPSCKGLSTFPSTVFGPTCDALDTVLRDKQLPDLCRGDWLVFPNMGAYAHAAATNFNGFMASNIRTKYVYSKPGISIKD